MNILLVTGSRAWDVDRRSARWARAQMALVLGGARPALREWGTPPDLVVHGDAPGADTYAEEIAAAMLLPRAVFSLRTGAPVLRTRSARDPRVTSARPLRDAGEWRYGSNPLERNAAMIRWAVEQMRAAHSVRVFALVAPWSPTGGTRHTLRLAEDAGLRAEVIAGDRVPQCAWPEEDSREGDPACAG